MNLIWAPVWNCGNQLLGCKGRRTSGKDHEASVWKPSTGADRLVGATKAEAAREGITLTRFVEQALQDRINRGRNASAVASEEVAERNRIMESLLLSTAHFRVGHRPTREEMNEMVSSLQIHSAFR